MMQAEVNDLRARLEKSEATRAKLRSSLIALKVRPTTHTSRSAPACRRGCVHPKSLTTFTPEPFLCFCVFSPCFLFSGIERIAA